MPLPISEGFILALVASGMACLGTVFKFLLKSRCSQIKLCCGCVDCMREPIPAKDLREVEITSPERTRPREIIPPV